LTKNQRPQKPANMLRKYLIPFCSLCLLALGLSNCLSDHCDSTITYVQWNPVSVDLAQLRQTPKIEPARALKNPGKIYYYEGHLIINEYQEGLHIFDNRDPQAPIPLSFIPIPGNVDMAVRNNILYADSWTDLVMFNIDQPSSPQFVGRVENSFPNFGVTPENKVIVAYKTSNVTQDMQPCDENRNGVINGNGGGIWVRREFANAAQDSRGGAKVPSPGGNVVGIGGSTARFTITENHLYTVDRYSLRVFDLKTATKPDMVNTVSIGWDIETIFPYQDKLFIGGESGMHIYDATNPEKPTFLGNFTHARACDPVVAQGDRAYVTLRSGGPCVGTSNQLDVLDISNITKPTLIKTYPMHNPIGLSIDGETLMICENDKGLKVFNAKDDQNIDKNLLEHVKDFHAFDVILLDDETAMVTGKDGIHQFDYRNPKKLKRLSTINISR
jgi:hypothetical protein